MNAPYPLMVSYAQQAEDVILRRLFSGQTEGRYVDIGAAHPVEHSVTKWFYEQGWSGINVEPQPDLYRRLCEDRPRDQNVNCAVGLNDKTCILADFSNHWGLSTTVDEVATAHQTAGLPATRYEVTMQRLDSILDKHCDFPIDFLKVDAEGAEEDVLRSIDLPRWAPTVLVVEATPPNSPAYHAPWEPLIIDQGYTRTLFDGLNNFYVRTDDKTRRALASVPSNVFDNFVPFTWWRRISTSHRTELTALFKKSGEDVAVLAVRGDELADLERMND